MSESPLQQPNLGKRRLSDDFILSVRSVSAIAIWAVENPGVRLTEQ